MLGLLTITAENYAEYKYFGFNGGHGIELWKKIDEWNIKNFNQKITIPQEEDFCDISQLPMVKNYVNFVKSEEEKQEYVYLIAVDDNLGDKNYIEDFTFVGYDCGYLRGEGFSLLFSCIPNELQRQIMYVNSASQPFVPKLNKYGLFESYHDVLAFQRERDRAIYEGNIQFIETAFRYFAIVGIYLYDFTNPLSHARRRVGQE